MPRRIARNIGANFAFRFVSLALALVSVPLLVRTVGAEGYGVMLLAESVMGYFSLLNGGVPAGTVKYVAERDARRDDEGLNRVIATSLGFFLAAGALVAVSVAAFAALGGIGLFRVGDETRGAATRVLYVAAAVAFASWPLGVFGQALDGLQRYPQNRLAMGLGSVTGRLLAIGAALAGAPLELVFLAGQSGTLLAASLQYRALRRALPQWRLRPRFFDRPTLHAIFGYSTWMLVIQVAALLFYQTDRIILGILLPISALTVHQVVTTPFRYVQEFSALFNTVLTPAVSAAEAREGREGLNRFIYTAGRYSNAFIAPLAVMGLFLSGPFISLWMGPEFARYAWIAQAACAFQLLWQSNSALARVFYGAGRVRTVALIAIGVSLLNVPLGVWWAGEIGVAGVVFATVAAGSLAVPLQYLFAMPELRIHRRRYLRDAVVRGQWSSWALALLLAPFWAPLQRVGSWPALAACGAGMAALLYGAVWLFALEPQHRRALLRMAPA